MPVVGEVPFLLPRGIREQPPHPPLAEPVRHPRRVQRVDLAGGEHARQRGPGRDRLDLHAGRRIVRQLGHPPGLCCPPVRYRTASTGSPCRSARMPRIHTLAVSWYSATPTCPARQLRRPGDPARRADVDPVVPERAGDEGRDGHERRARLQADQVGGQRHLGGVELPVPRHPEERLLDRQRQEGQVDPLRPDVPAGQRRRSGHRPRRPGVSGTRMKAIIERVPFPPHQPYPAQLGQAQHECYRACR